MSGTSQKTRKSDLFIVLIIEKESDNEINEVT